MMKKKIFYWSPCLNPVGTVKSTLNSASSLIKYNQDEYDVYLINACGEWDQYFEFINSNSIKLINFKFKYFKYLPKRGYVQSRFSYVLIFILSFFPLIKLQTKANFLALVLTFLFTALTIELFFSIIFYLPQV